MDRGVAGSSVTPSRYGRRVEQVLFSVRRGGDQHRPHQARPHRPSLTHHPHPDRQPMARALWQDDDQDQDDDEDQADDDPGQEDG